MLKVDGKFYNGLVVIYRLMVLNALMLVFSLPIITCGASLSAGFSVLQENKPNGFVKSFLTAFRRSFVKTLLPLGFTLLTIIFGLSLYLNASRQFSVFRLMRLVFISFLVCFNLNIYLLQNLLPAVSAYKLLKESFLFTAMSFMRTVLFPLGALLVSWLAVTYLGDFIIVILLSSCVAVYLFLIKSPLQQFVNQIQPGAAPLPGSKLKRQLQNK